MLRNTQRLRVIINGVSFFSTVRQVRDGVGDFTKVNAAAAEALTALELTRASDGIAEQCTVGLSGTWHGFQVQLNIID